MPLAGPISYTIAGTQQKGAPMNRVSVCLSAVVVAALSLPLRADEPDRSGAKKLGWKLTLQSWTNNKKTVYDSIDLCQQLGVHYLECYPGQRLSPEDKGKFDEKMTDDQVKAVLDKAKACNVKIIDWAKKVGLTTLVSEPEPKDLPMIDKLAGEYDIRVAIHDHPKPSRYCDPEYTYGLIKDLKNVGFCADVGHWKRSGFEPVEV